VFLNLLGNLAFPLLLVGGLFLLSRRSGGAGGMGGPGGNNPLAFGECGMPGRLVVLPPARCFRCICSWAGIVAGMGGPGGKNLLACRGCGKHIRVVLKPYFKALILVMGV
jgi:hypothetical protein